MSPQLQILLLNYVKRLTTWVTWAAGTGAVAFYAQPETAQAAQIASLGFSPAWIPFVTLALHVLVGARPQPPGLATQPVPPSAPPTDGAGPPNQ